MKTTLLLFSFLLSLINFSQETIQGIVKDEKGNPIHNANISIIGFYDGEVSDENGYFSFETDIKNEVILEIEKIGFNIEQRAIRLPLVNLLQITLSQNLVLDDVVFTAGSLKANSNSNKTVLKPIDVVTTAGSAGDIIAALQTLPGANPVSEDGRLFIRGGESDETSIFIDRLRVFQPYTQTAPNTPARGRYSPFLFKGINFSTGGYSVPYGQALSGILELETEDFPTENSTDLSFMTLGVGAAVNKAWQKDALTVNGFYYNLQPMFSALKTRDEWDKAPQGISGESVYRHQFNKGLLKSYIAMDYSLLNVFQKNINNENDWTQFKMNSTNTYFNNSYTHNFNKDIEGFIGFSYANAKTHINQANNKYQTINTGFNAKYELNWRINTKNNLKIGSELINYNTINENVSVGLLGKINEDVFSIYTQYTWYFAKRLGLKSGVRTEHSSWIKQWNIAPRISLAYKLKKNHNISLLYGEFYQSPNQSRYNFNPQEFAKSTQFLFNYFYAKNNQIIRLELYQKNYKNLTLYNPIDYTQNGEGYARGIDFFCRNNGTHIKNLEYWISYSYIDTERFYKDFPTNAQPSFVANHNASIVGKYWFNSLRSQLQVSYNYGSGRPYNNPNTTDFMNEKTKSYNALNVSWAYLIDQQKILFFSVSNVLGAKNVNGYRYTDIPNEHGFFDRQAITPSLDRFAMVGFFWTISSNKNKNQLNNL